MKSLLGIAPQQEPDGSYRPSKLAMKLGTSTTTDFSNRKYDKYQGPRNKVLVIATEQKNMTMANGKKFSTGNHPVEILVPMLHLRNAGFDLEIATPTGAPAVLEMWAFPSEDEHVKAIHEDFSASLANPISLAEFVSTSLGNFEQYAAVFVPGGHGAVLGLPDDDNVAAALNWAHENDLFTVTLCHGPAALLATTLHGQEFLYEGYKLAVFPDSVDKQTPMIGYLPGKMPSLVSTKLEDLGATLINKKADETVCLDRKLITGASPKAANPLGELAATTLLDHATKNNW
jgi:molecular chaperone Hsp31 and glyoxalase 3